MDCDPQCGVSFELRAKPAMRQLIQRASRSAVSWSLIAAALRFGSGLLLLPLILWRIPSDELGLWYLFISLGALAVLIDLGFAHASARSAGYLWAGSTVLLPFGINVAERLVETDTAGRAIHRQPNLPMLSNLVASLRVYYLSAGGLLLLLLTTAGGAWIWRQSAGLANAQSIRLAFVVYSVGVSLGFANSLWPTLLAGINAVKEAQQIMVACLLANFCLTVAGLLVGWGIWALVLGTFVAVLAEGLIGRMVFQRLVSVPAGKFDFSVIRVLWPNAWRTAAVGFGAFMILQANILICSAFLDLRTTASYGLSLQAVTLLVGLSSIWVRVKLPTINYLRAQGMVERIPGIFRSRIALALLTFGAGALILLVFGRLLLARLNTQTQLLPAALLATLLLIQLLEMHHSLYGELVYSENVNPFVKPALISGVAIITLSVLLTPRFGVWGMLLASGLVQLCFNNWWPVVRAIRGLGPAGQDYWRWRKAS
jgi:O-antigen/teichoic acid export membrane protein